MGVLRIVQPRQNVNKSRPWSVGRPCVPEDPSRREFSESRVTYCCDVTLRGRLDINVFAPAGEGDPTARPEARTGRLLVPKINLREREIKLRAISKCLRRQGTLLPRARTRRRFCGVFASCRAVNHCRGDEQGRRIRTNPPAKPRTPTEANTHGKRNSYFVTAIVISAVVPNKGCGSKRLEKRETVQPE